jgi:DNA-binding XRE family transcriptional regulator
LPRKFLGIFEQHFHEIHQLFFHDTYWPALIADLRAATALVLIHVPYVTSRGIDRLADAFRECARREVLICVFLEKPEFWDRRTDDSLPMETARRLSQIEKNIDLMRSWGVHVTMLEQIHEKVVVIDEDILWDGSLNFLSHYKTSERLNRWRSRKMAQDAIQQHGLDSCGECAELKGAERDEIKALGRKILQRRQALGLSQSQLAARVGCAQTLISAIEVGKRDCRASTLLRVCRALQLQLTCLPAFMVPGVEARTEAYLTKHNQKQP